MRRLFFLTLALGVIAACGSSAGENGLTSPNAGTSDGTGSGSGPSLGNDDGGAPPEQEAESQYKAPVATGKYVWVANPTSGRVAYINAATLDVRTVEAGNGPTYLAAVPNAEDTAIVLNVLSDDATLLHANGADVTSSTFKTAHGMNTWAISPDGHWAIAWTDARQVPNALQTQGFQDLTVIDLTGKIAPVVLAVGYRPISVGFTTKSDEAWAVTQDGIAIIDVSHGAPAQTANVAISDDPSDDPGTRDVSVLPDGSFAIVRRDGSPSLTVVNIPFDQRTSITLSGNVTDFDLSNDGTKGVAVVRDTATASIMPFPAAILDATKIVNVKLPDTVGSVSLSPTGGTGLLYTNAIDIEKLDVLDLGLTAPAARAVKLYSPVFAVVSAPDAKHAVVIHQASATDPSGDLAFSIVPIAAALPAKIVSTMAKPFAVAFANAGDHVIVAEKDTTKKIYGIYLGKLPQLMVDRYDLASPPVAVGVVDGARRAYVAQDYVDGRITFVDLDSGEARTLTGFELAARVVDGSKP